MTIFAGLGCNRAHFCALQFQQTPQTPNKDQTMSRCCGMGRGRLPLSNQNKNHLQTKHNNSSFPSIFSFPLKRLSNYKEFFPSLFNFPLKRLSNHQFRASNLGDSNLRAMDRLSYNTYFHRGQTPKKA